jgi:hypothetical protein
MMGIRGRGWKGWKMGDLPKLRARVGVEVGKSSEKVSEIPVFIGIQEGVDLKSWKRTRRQKLG